MEHIELDGVEECMVAGLLVGKDGKEINRLAVWPVSPFWKEMGAKSKC